MMLVVFHIFEAVVGITVTVQILRMIYTDRDMNKKYREEIQAKLDDHICDAECRFDELSKDN